ncbi:hypothetical protein F5B21DRAFT_98034 [Xylaria acuta]|nr:hypothetical protein F5B21DRAFT_98034 [Xylaria acuta]
MIFVFIDLEFVHCFLVPSPLQPPISLLRSLDFSLVLSLPTLHEQRDYSSALLCNGPCARLCIVLSDIARFGSMRFVTIRLDLARDDDDEVGGWRRVHERWALFAVRGILSCYLTVQLPDIAHLEQPHPYQYLDGDKTPF